ncbi:unnamed protein product [marine sediment metagenome]|uniref:F5/8 type C domain-containing protein n=1 Tax=marine sediment metagenome TaxID=412755 RepID=X0XU97_9ZZZZ
MSGIIQYNLAVSGTPVVGYDGTGDFTTDAFRLCFNHAWAFSVTDSTTGGSPDYTIEVSNDDVQWYEYNSDSTNVSLDDGVDDTHMVWKYFRVVYDSTGVGSGTVTFWLSLKPN